MSELILFWFLLRYLNNHTIIFYKSTSLLKAEDTKEC